MDRETFEAIKHGEHVADFRTAHPQVMDLDIHRVSNADEDHPVDTNNAANFAIAEREAGKTVGIVAIDNIAKEETPRVTINRHPNYSHIEAGTIAHRAMLAAMGEEGVEVARFNEKDSNIKPFDDGQELHLH